MLRILERLLGEEPLPLDLDVERLRNIWHYHVNQLAHPKHHVLKDDHEGKLKCKYLPVDGSEGAGIISEASVVTFGLNRERWINMLSKIIGCLP